MNIDLDGRNTEDSKQSCHGSQVSLDEVKDQYYYEDFGDASLVDQSNQNSGYYAELLLDYNDKLFLTTW